MPEVIEIREFATYHCDDCTEGRMYPTGNLWGPDRVEHQCSKCGSFQNFDKCYETLWDKYG
jgi:hypothetical protein